MSNKESTILKWHSSKPSQLMVQFSEAQVSILLITLLQTNTHNNWYSRIPPMELVQIVLSLLRSELLMQQSQRAPRPLVISQIPQAVKLSQIFTLNKQKSITKKTLTLKPKTLKSESNLRNQATLKSNKLQIRWPKSQDKLWNHTKWKEAKPTSSMMDKRRVTMKNTKSLRE